MKHLLAALFILISFFSAAQEQRGKISITITSEQNTPLEGVTVELRRSKDSSLVKTAITDKSGMAEFENMKQGVYMVKTSMVGYAPAFSSSVQLTVEQLSVAVPSLQLRPSSNNALQNIMVTGKKPFIQKLSDRIVVNVENSIVSAGSTALEVLERSPGVTVDQNDAISLRGRAGVIIMIDGKPTPMTGADLANYLRGLFTNGLPL